MSLNDVPTALVVLLPGFLAIRVFFWTSRPRQLEQLESLLWSAVAALAVLWLATWLWGPLYDEQVTFLGALNTPRTVPGGFVVTLYPAALFMGATVGYADRFGIVAALARPLGIADWRSPSVWRAIFVRRRWCYFYLTDGTQIYGWPEVVSTHRDGDTPTEVYVTGVMVRTTRGWEELGRAGMLLDAVNIRRIDVSHDVPDPTSGARSSPSTGARNAHLMSVASVWLLMIAATTATALLKSCSFLVTSAAVVALSAVSLSVLSVLTRPRSPAVSE